MRDAHRDQEKAGGRAQRIVPVDNRERTGTSPRGHAEAGWRPRRSRPALIYHADWSCVASKRWGARAVLGADGRYRLSVPAPVGDPTTLLRRLRTEGSDGGPIFAGFDFPIGVPIHYAAQARVARFRDFLRLLGLGPYADFFAVCDLPEEISIERPFYPKRSSAGARRQHLLNGTRAPDMTALLRRCERNAAGQRQACSLFWTLGGNQVGKGALVGWKEVIIPALPDGSVRLWPFDGELHSLLQPGNIVLAETYPAEYYRWFAERGLRSKTDRKCRQDFGFRLLSWAEEREIAVETSLRSALRDGFPSGGDDAFDAAVGLFGMLSILLGERATGEPATGEPGDTLVRDVEGWILGRFSPPRDHPEPVPREGARTRKAQGTKP